MTEYEIIDVISSLRSEAAQHVMNFVSVMFGFIVAAYLVGPKLSRFQVSVITILYVIWTPGPMWAAYDASTAVQQLYAQYHDVLPIELGASPLTSHAPVVVTVGIATSWVMSLAFLFQVRATKQG
ncbi:MAG: hypothetical protein DRQ98_12570 [Gammaproteobacteria bacterium]|nr:MAG: hypothetical protein DRQ98_12570 [Gammaproteobacteria bacterium]